MKVLVEVVQDSREWVIKTPPCVDGFTNHRWGCADYRATARCDRCGAIRVSVPYAYLPGDG